MAVFFLAGARFAGLRFDGARFDVDFPRAGPRRVADFFRTPAFRAGPLFTAFRGDLRDDLRGDLRDDLRGDFRGDFRAVVLRRVVFFATDFFRVAFFAVFLAPALRAAIGTLLG